MDDREVAEAFAAGGARQAFGDKLHIEGDCLVFDGWWEAAFRVSPTTFAVRDEEPPEPTDTLDQLRSRLGSAGLRPVDANPALLVAITYTAIDLGAADWALWSRDSASAEAALAARAGHDTFLSDAPSATTSGGPFTDAPFATASGGPFGGGDPGGDLHNESPFGAHPFGTGDASDYAAEMGGARRSAGLPALVVLTVGLDDEIASAMAESLPDCRIEARALGELDVHGCAALMPNLVLVDATSVEGEAFVVDLRAAGRSAPLVAVHAGGPLAGADATVDPAAAPAEWAEHLRALLP